MNDYLKLNYPNIIVHTENNRCMNCDQFKHYSRLINYNDLTEEQQSAYDDGNLDKEDPEISHTNWTDYEEIECIDCNEPGLSIDEVEQLEEQIEQEHPDTVSYLLL